MKKRSTQLGKIFIFSFLFSASVQAQTTINYTVDNTSNFANPERGWAIQFVQDQCCDSLSGGINFPPHGPISASYLTQLRASSDVMSVYTDIVKIQQTASDIPQSRLAEIQADLNTARQAGAKVNFRIIYNYSMNFGDASPYWLDRHLNQLGPIIAANSDIIMAVDAGLYGGSGEACCTSDYVDESDPNWIWGRLTPDGITLYDKLLSFIPVDRFMLLRYPRWKYLMMGWDNGTNYPTNTQPVTATTAFNGSRASRFGYYNDNFAGDINHWGFFNSWEQLDRDFTEADSKYTYMRGEISGTSDYNVPNGASEMAKYHFSTFHAIGNSSGSSNDLNYDGVEVLNLWKQNGQYDVMTKKLGYRFSLNSATIPTGTFSPNSTFNLSFNMTNSGWSGIVNPRNFEIVFRNTSTGAIYRKVYDGDSGKGNRLFLPTDGETKTLTVNTTIPNNIANGTYQVLLHLADPYPSLHDRPEYSIRLANTGLWEPAKGFNNLNRSITIINGIADVTPPSAPTGLTASEFASNSFKLSWQPSTDNVGVASYEVFIGGVSKGTTTTTSMVFSGMSPGADFLMSVKARDAVNNISNSSPVLKVSTYSRNLGTTPQSGTATGYRWSFNTTAASNNNRNAATGINDGNLQTSVQLNEGNWDISNAYEAAGIVWSVAQTKINRVSFINGDLNQYGYGNFAANLTFQFTTDGSTWLPMPTGWSLAPSYPYNSGAAGVTYSFSGPSIASCRGVRVVGQVYTSEYASLEASIKEVLVYFDAKPTGYRWVTNTTATANTNRYAAAEVNDGVLNVTLRLNTTAYDNANAYEAAGIVYPVAQQNISRVDFINGSDDFDGNGYFTANLSLQFSTNGTTWTPSGWTVSPPYSYNNNVLDNTYSFTGTPESNIKGVRIVGQVRTNPYLSWEGSVKEVIVYYSGGTASARAGTLSADNLSSFGDSGAEYNNLSTFEVYPNPAQNTVTISTTAEKGQIRISSLNGHILKRVQCTNHNSTIDISGLSPGVYIVTVEGMNQKAQSKRFIVVR